MSDRGQDHALGFGERVGEPLGILAAGTGHRASASPPPPTSAAAPLTTSDALTLSATASSKFAINVTFPSSTPPSTTAAGRDAA